MRISLPFLSTGMANHIVKNSMVNDTATITITLNYRSRGLVQHSSPFFCVSLTLATNVFLASWSRLDPTPSVLKTVQLTHGAKLDRSNGTTFSANGKKKRNLFGTLLEAQEE